MPTREYRDGDAGVCRGCGAKITWRITEAGRRMPVDPDGRAHFATCPDANSFRKKRGDE